MYVFVLANQSDHLVMTPNLPENTLRKHDYVILYAVIFKGFNNDIF